MCEVLAYPSGSYTHYGRLNERPQRQNCDGVRHVFVVWGLGGTVCDQRLDSEILLLVRSPSSAQSLLFFFWQNYSEAENQIDGQEYFLSPAALKTRRRFTFELALRIDNRMH